MSYSSSKQSRMSGHSNGRLTESDIETIWKSMKRPSEREIPSPEKKRKEKKGPSIDTTPTTDYSGNLILLHPASLDDELRMDRETSKMRGVLRAKKMKPKSFLPQVILYDNVSRERLLEIRMKDIHHAHKVAEKRAKRRHEKFVRGLERKQDGWTKRDARAVAKVTLKMLQTRQLEPEGASELSFMFGRLYNKPDHPYQDAVLSLTQPPQRLNHARRRPIQLPDVSRRTIYDDEEEDKTFVTKLPKLHRGRQRRGGGHQMGTESSRGGEWTSDARFHTLTSILGERYSGKKHANPAIPYPT